MATDYDAPRKTDDELSEDSIEELKARRVDKTASAVDEDEIEAAEGFELPGADLSNEELSVRVLPRQADEFTCSQLLPRAPPQPARQGGGRPADLQGVRGLTTGAAAATGRSSREDRASGQRGIGRAGALQGRRQPSRTSRRRPASRASGRAGRRRSPAAPSPIQPRRQR